MKTGIEELFKNSLQHQEEAYDPTSWASMQARLDKAMPTTPPKSGFSGKTYGLGAASIAAIVLSAWYFTKENEVEQHANAKTVKNAIVSETSSNETAKNTKNLITSPETTSTDATIGQTDQNQSAQTSSKQTIELPITNTVQSILPISFTSINNTYVKPNPLSTVTEPKFGHNVFLSTTSVCENTELTLKNDVNEAILVKVEGKTIQVSKLSSIAMKLTKAGNQEIEIVGKNGVMLDNISVLVKTAPTPDVNFGEFEYQNGLPTIEAKITNSDEFASSKWYFGKHEVSDDSKASIHPYKKGQHPVFINVTGQNGCNMISEMSIQVENDYNLLANTGITLSSSDPLVSSFMPRALLLRNAGFTLQILDIRTRQVVYETSDINSPWNGTNSSTGQMAVAGTYVWTVSLQHPEPNEQAQYRGELVVQ